MKEELGLIEMWKLVGNEPYHWFLFTDIDNSSLNLIEEISGSLEFDILGE